MTFFDQLFVNVFKALLSFLGRFLPEPAVVVIKMVALIVVFAVIAPLIMMYLTWMERKIVGRIQNRIGPNRVGKYGLLQPLADGVKMLTKEDIVPTGADRVTHFLSPVLVVVPALLLFSFLPFGRGMTAINPDAGILLFFALSATSTLAIFMGAWGSRNKYSLLGAMRVVAQMVSYEVPFVLSVVAAVMQVGSLSIEEIVKAQGGPWGLNWFVFTPWGFVGFFLLFLTSTAEANRTPFDLPEAESEIIAGFHTEYSGMKFALFYMAEFLGMFALSALTATLFLGGWNGPFSPPLPSWLWFFVKTYALVFIMMWFRGTLPRLRVDQLMGLAWKIMLPMALVNIGIAGLWHFISQPALRLLVCWGLALGSFLALAKINEQGTIEKRTYVLAD